MEGRSEEETLEVSLLSAFVKELIDGEKYLGGCHSPYWPAVVLQLELILLSVYVLQFFLVLSSYKQMTFKDIFSPTLLTLNHEPWK